MQFRAQLVNGGCKREQNVVFRKDNFKSTRSMCTLTHHYHVSEVPKHHNRWRYKLNLLKWPIMISSCCTTLAHYGLWLLAPYLLWHTHWETIFPFDLHRKGRRFCCHFFRFAARRQVYRTILTQFLSLQPRKYAKSAYFLSCRHRKCVRIVAQTQTIHLPLLISKSLSQAGIRTRAVCVGPWRCITYSIRAGWNE